MLLEQQMKLDNWIQYAMKEIDPKQWVTNLGKKPSSSGNSFLCTRKKIPKETVPKKLTKVGDYFDCWIETKTDKSATGIFRETKLEWIANHYNINSGFILPAKVYMQWKKIITILLNI